MTTKKLACAGLVAAAIAGAPLSAQAASLLDGTGSFDAYRAAAVTAGLMVGATVAVVVTDGLIIPVLSTAANAVPGTGTATGATLAVVRGALNLFGAVAGGLYADNLYIQR